MKMVFWAGAGTLFPFLMTILGAALVFLMKKQSEDGPCMGFAAGVMSAAAVFSMILPAMRQNEGGWLIVTLGFMLGAAMIAGVDALMCRVRRIQNASDSARKRLMMVAAITLHNIPEGMAVGLAFALAGVQGGLAAAAVLALGIGVQNLPEGAGRGAALSRERPEPGKELCFGCAQRRGRAGFRHAGGADDGRGAERPAGDDGILCGRDDAGRLCGDDSAGGEDPRGRCRRDGGLYADDGA
ncbi:MAG: ZIP family metal transporter [Christensenellales bacterium]